MKKLAIFVVAILFVGLIFTSGCAGDEETDAVDFFGDMEIPDDTKVKGVEIASVLVRDKNKDGFAEELELDLRPIDGSGNLVIEDIFLDVTLWHLDCSKYSAVESCGVKDCKFLDEDLLDFWIFEIKEADFNPRPKLNLPYEVYQATEDKTATACIKVELMTMDGNSFERIFAPVYLNKP